METEYDEFMNKKSAAPACLREKAKKRQKANLQIGVYAYTNIANNKDSKNRVHHH